MTESTAYSTPAERFGHDVLGPIMAEFCLRLWAVVDQMDRPDDVVLLFCARGGLRLQTAYDRFLAATGYESPVAAEALMVSRLVAIRTSLARTVRSSESEIGPAAATAVSYEFARSSVTEWASALSGAPPRTGTGRWDVTASPSAVGRLLAHPDGELVRAGIVEQSLLFRRHLDGVLAGRRHAVLVDTGLYGTTRQLLAEGVTDVDFGSALIARAHRPGDRHGGSRSVGLSVNASEYSPLRNRTALLRHWHFVEWFLEPDLPSVRQFDDAWPSPRSNLEVPDWRERLTAVGGSPFSGVLAYLDGLGPAPAARIAADATRAWPALRRAIAFPSPTDADSLRVGTRSHDFGSDETWSARAWRGNLAALRGSSMWREGEIAESATRLRLPLLICLEAAYGIRGLRRRLRANR